MAENDMTRSLLLGLLALREGLVDAPALLAAFDAWCDDRSAFARADPPRIAGTWRPKTGTGSSPPSEGTPSSKGRPPAVSRPRRARTRGRGGAAGVPGRPTSRRPSPIPLPEGDPIGPLGDSGREGGRASTTVPSSRFEILVPHAEGGLGQVYRAIDRELGREVALKTIREGRADDPESRARFALEGKITGMLEHPGIVPVYGMGRDAEGRPYYAMRLIRGQSLREAIREYHGPAARSPARLRELLGRLVQVCQAVEYAHSRGVIHRDLKPENIMLGPFGEALAVDWGLAKVSDRPAEEEAGGMAIPPWDADGSETSLSGRARGTLGYMSPEQAAGALDRVGPASDVYSLGATLYCLLTGRPPLLPSDPGSMLDRAARGEFPRPERRPARASIPTWSGSA